jgi:hypothetical protein
LTLVDFGRRTLTPTHFISTAIVATRTGGASFSHNRTYFIFAFVLPGASPFNRQLNLGLTPGWMEGYMHVHTNERVPMKNCFELIKKTTLVLMLTGTLFAASCTQPPQAIPPAAATEIGRYQVVQTGQALILLDSKEGRTWVWRPPIGTPAGNAFNGFWTDVPRFDGVKYPPQIMNAILQVLTQQHALPSSATNSHAAHTATSTNAPAKH